MIKNNYLHLLCLAFCFCFISNAQLDKNKGNIHGEVALDTTIWESTVYLSYIPTFDYMPAISYDLIVSATEIDSLGQFQFDLSFLPEEDLLYRIHIPKRNASPISLIIGGKEENHLFFIANKHSKINFKSLGHERLFGNTNFSEDKVNNDLQRIFNILKREETIDFNSTLLQRQLIKDDINKELITIAEHNLNPLVALFALLKSDKEAIDYNLISKFNDKWSSQSNDYFEAYRANTNIENTSSINYTLFVIVSLVLILVIIVFIYFYKTKRTSSNKKQLESLSIQERKILQLIKQGLSNKQISDECHIELSTVKSHINSIYSKLNVKSRKDVIKI